MPSNNMTDAERVREQILDQAVRDRKITAAEKPQYRAKFINRPKGTRKLLTASVSEGGLMPGIVPEGPGLPDDYYPPEWLGTQRPTAPQASAPVVTNSAPVQAPSPAAGDSSSYPAGWLPEVEARAAAGDRGLSQITIEG